MSRDIEPMDVDDFGEYSSVLKESAKTPNKFQYYNDFDDKENSCNVNIADNRFKIAAGDKSFDAFDDSCTNMKLRWSCTPGSSPAINRSAYDSRDRSMNNSLVDNSNSTFTAADFENGNAILSSHNYSSDVQNMDMSLDNSRITIVGHTSSTNISLDSCKNNTLVQDQSIESNKVPDVSISSVEEVKQDVTSPLSISIRNDNQSNSKDYQGASSPILRGIKSVINMFRPSQSPISPNRTSPNGTGNLNKTTEEPSPTVNMSKGNLTVTPDKKKERKKSITNRTLEGENKKQDSSDFVTVFKEDFINDIQWNDDSTIIFNTRKLKGNRSLQDGESHSLSSTLRLSSESQNMQSRGSSLSKMSPTETYDNTDHSLSNEKYLKSPAKSIPEETQNEMRKSFRNNSADIDDDKTINVGVITENKLLENRPNEETSVDTSPILPTAVTPSTKHAVEETFLRYENNVQGNVSKDCLETSTNVQVLETSNLSQLSSPLGLIMNMTASNNDISRAVPGMQIGTESKRDLQVNAEKPLIPHMMSQQNVTSLLEDNLQSSENVIVNKKDASDQRSLFREENNSPIEEFEDCLEQLSEAQGLEFNFEPISAPISESFPVDNVEKCNNILPQTIIQDQQMPVIVQNLDNTNVVEVENKRNIVDKILLKDHINAESKLQQPVACNSENTETKEDVFPHYGLDNNAVIRGQVTDSSSDIKQNIVKNYDINSVMTVEAEMNGISTVINIIPEISMKEESNGSNIEILFEKEDLNISAGFDLGTDNNVCHTDTTSLNSMTSIDLTKIKPDLESNKIRTDIETEQFSDNSENTLAHETKVSSVSPACEFVIEDITPSLNTTHLADEDIDHNVKIEESIFATECPSYEDVIRRRSSTGSQNSVQIITKTEIKSSMESIQPNNITLEQSIPVGVENNKIAITSINLNTDLKTHLASNETVTLDSEIDISKYKSAIDLNAQCLVVENGDQKINGIEISCSKLSNEQNINNTLPVEMDTNLSANISCAINNEAVLSHSQLDDTIDLNEKHDNELVNINMRVQTDLNILHLKERSIDDIIESPVSKNNKFNEDIANPCSQSVASITNIKISPQRDSGIRECGFESTIDPFKTNTKIRLSPEPEGHHLNAPKEIANQSLTSKTVSESKMDLGNNKMDIDEDVPDTLILGNNIANAVRERPDQQDPQCDIPSMDVTMEVSADCRDVVNFSQNATTLSVSLDTVKSDLTGELQSNKNASQILECEEPGIFQPIKASTCNDLGTEMNFEVGPQMKINDNVVDEPEDVEIKKIMQTESFNPDENENPFMTRTKIRMSPNIEEKLSVDKEVSFDTKESPFASRSLVGMSPTFDQRKVLTQDIDDNTKKEDLTRVIVPIEEKKQAKDETYIAEQVTASNNNSITKKSKTTPNKQKQRLIRKSHGSNILSATPKKIVTPTTDIKHEEKFNFETIENPFATRTTIRMSPTLNEMQNKYIENHTPNTNKILIQTTIPLDTTYSSEMEQTKTETSEQIPKVSENVESPSSTNTAGKITPTKQKQRPLQTTEGSSNIHENDPFVTQPKVRLSPSLENKQIHNIKTEFKNIADSQKHSSDADVKLISNVLKETVDRNEVNATKTMDNNSIDISDSFATRSKVRLSLENQQIHNITIDAESAASHKFTRDIDVKTPSNVLNETVDTNTVNETKTMDNNIDISNPFATRSKVRLSPSLENQQIHNITIESDSTASRKLDSNINVKTPAHVLNETVNLNETNTLDSKDIDNLNPFATRSKVRLSPSLENQQIDKLHEEFEKMSVSQIYTNDLNETVNIDKMNATKTIQRNDIDISNPFITKSKIRASPTLDVTITNSDQITMNSSVENGETTYIKKSDSVLEISQIINKNELTNTTNGSSEKKEEKSLDLSGDQTFDKSSNETILNLGQQNESTSPKTLTSLSGLSVHNEQKQLVSDAVTMEQEENDEEFVPAEMFFKDEAVDYLMNQKTSTADRGKDSLFIKFDPLYVANGKSNIEKIDAASTHGNVLAKTRLSDSFHEKPVLAVSPAINSDQIKPIIQTPPRQENIPLRFVSPAIAAIDKLISQGVSPVRGSPCTMLVDVRDTSSANFFQQQLETAKRLLSEREEDYKKKLSDLEKSNTEHAANVKGLEAKLLEQFKQNAHMIKLNEEYEQTIVSLLSKREDEKKKQGEENSRLVRERDEQTAHLSSMEHSFNDLHAKYEKCKSMILSYKSNEELLKKKIADSEANCKKLEEAYEQIKKHASTKLIEANQTLETMKKAHKVETVKLNALIKRKELDISSLQETLTQKIKDSEGLESICDELLKKIG